MFNNSRKIFLFVVTALAACAAIAPGAQAAWTSAPFTLPSTTSQLNASSCVSTTFCVLTGVQSGGSTQGLTYKYTGTYSSVAPASTTFEPYGVHCTSTTFCMAVGTDYAAATPTARAEKFNGTHWTGVTVANPAGSAFTEVRGVACTGSTHCWAAGRFQTTTSTALIETYNGTSFSQVAVTPPAGTTSAQLNAIACSAVNACTAVGWADSANPRTSLIFRYNGTSWTTQAAAVPAGATYSELDGVACPAAAICHAVGTYQDSSGVYRSLAQSWNGASWTNRAVATPAGGEDPALSSVSCWSTTACEAVGSYTDSTNLNIEKQAAGWNGSAWSLQSVPRPMSVSDAELNGVSCVSAVFCRAAGASVYDGTTGVTGQRASIDAGP
jgi:hypothetical protein